MDEINASGANGPVQIGSHLRLHMPTFERILYAEFYMLVTVKLPVFIAHMLSLLIRVVRFIKLGWIGAVKN